MTEAEFYELVDKSREYLGACQRRLQTEFKLESYPRFDWSQDTGQLVFSDATGTARLVADFQFVGTLSTSPQTWRWAWANDSLLPAVTQAVLEVKRFGQMHELPPLLQEEWEAVEADGWDMTALAVNLLQAEGAYRAPGANGLSFLALTRVAWPQVAG
jgi:hypothetical protein